MQLVRETDKGGIDYATATPRAWLEDGKTVAFEDGATYYGKTSMKIESQAAKGTITATIQPPDRKLQRGRRKVCFEVSTAEVTVIPRQSLAVGEEVAGPAVIEERESTTVLWPGDRAVVHASSALVISVGTTS